MLRKERIQQYFFATSAAAVKHLEAFRKSSEADDLHRFRVDLKRLKAVLRMMKSHPLDSKLLNLFKPVDKIFRQAGAIRTIDVNLELISGYPEVKRSFIASQEKLRKKKAKIFNASSGKNKLKIKECCQKIASLFFDVDEKYIIRKFRKHIHKIADSLKKNVRLIDVMHQDRKKIKTLLYTYDLLPETIAKKLTLNTRYLTRLQRAIGDLHDRVLARDILAEARYKDTRDFQQIALDMEQKQRSMERLIANFEKKVNRGSK